MSRGSHGFDVVVMWDDGGDELREINMETWKGYDAWKTRTPNDDADHHPLCPQHEDADIIYECGGRNEHVVHETNGACLPDEPNCTCDELRASDKADAAEYRADCRADR